MLDDPLRRIVEPKRRRPREDRDAVRMNEPRLSLTHAPDADLDDRRSLSKPPRSARVAPTAPKVFVAEIGVRVEIENRQIGVCLQGSIHTPDRNRVFSPQQAHQLALGEEVARHDADTLDHGAGAVRLRFHFLGRIDANLGDIALQLEVPLLQLLRSVDDRPRPIARAGLIRRRAVVRYWDERHSRILMTHRNGRVEKGLPRARDAVGPVAATRRHCRAQPQVPPAPAPCRRTPLSALHSRIRGPSSKP